MLPEFTVSLSDPAWLILAFALGMAARAIGLPPMVGYLIAGFGLAGYGVEAGTLLNGIADLGITLMLFTIGLKISVGTLKAPEILGVGVIHMVTTVVVATVLLLGLGAISLALFDGVSLQTAAVVAFAMSFSSTVFAVKVLEEKGEFSSRHGKIAIGILVIQDIVAVVFMAASTGTVPSILALGLVGLIFIRKPLDKLAQKAGHGELLLLFGFGMALAGYALFELVNLKGDLGAIVFGVLLAGSSKAGELNKALGTFKDIFLIGFFLSIGQAGLPDANITFTALVLLVLLIPKTLLWMMLFLRFHLGGRVSFLSTLTLGNYSEFALIVAAVAVDAGWLASEWLVTLALTVSLSFCISAPINAAANRLFARFQDEIRPYETSKYLKEDRPIDLAEAKALIFGMGRVGSAAFLNLAVDGPERVIGFDTDSSVVELHCDKGRNVLRGDANDPELWNKLVGYKTHIDLIVLATPYLQSNLSAIQLLRSAGFRNKIATVALYPDDEMELYAHGADSVYNIYQEAGDGIAAEIEQIIDKAA
ncbi:MAG: cation:proton antiporter [Pseudomonadota bacterium]